MKYLLLGIVGTALGGAMIPPLIIASLGLYAYTIKL
jgi:hypothetical protein